jgi:hypothetical protein
MYAARQELVQGIQSSALNEALERGARVVWIQPQSFSDDHWDVVLETYVEDSHPETIVLDFLAHVDTGTLENKMLEGADMGTGVGKSAINALAEMVKPSAP